MSSESEWNAEVVAFYATYRSFGFFQHAAFTFFVYDFAATFDREVRYFWGRRFSIASALFLSIRYGYLLQVLVNIISSSNLKGPGCQAVQWMNAVYSYSVNLPFAVFSGARAYALCRTWTISGLITLLSLAPLCVDWVDWALFQTPALDPNFGCVVDDVEPLQDSIIFVISARLPLIIADVFLVIMTWRNLGGDLKSLRLPFVKHSSTSFSNVLLGNGLLYFVMMFVLNSLHLIFSATSIFTDVGSGVSKLSEFTIPLTAILVYRFILDLQGVNEHNVRVGSDDPELLQMSQVSSQSSLSFVDRAIGSLGATIRPGAARARDEWDEWDEPEDVVQMDERDSRSDDAYLAALDDLAVHAPPEPEVEIQDVPRDERVAQAV